MCYIIFIHIVPERDGDFWNEKTGLNMTAREIEDWTVEGRLPQLLLIFTLTNIVENRVQCARAEAEFLRWNEQVELKHAEILRLRTYNMSFRSIWLTLAERWESCKPGMAAYARRKADRFQKMVANVDAEWEGVGVPELCNIPSDKTLVDQVLARRKSEITSHLPGYRYVQTAAYLCVLMIYRFPIPKDNSFSSVEELQAKYKGESCTGNTQRNRSKRKAI
jgi:hypothetical protein